MQGHKPLQPARGVNPLSGLSMETGKRRLAGDTARAANSDEVKVLHRQTRDLKEVVAEQFLELRLLKKGMFGGGGDHERGA